MHIRKTYKTILLGSVIAVVWLPIIGYVVASIAGKDLVAPNPVSAPVITPNTSKDTPKDTPKEPPTPSAASSPPPANRLGPCWTGPVQCCHQLLQAHQKECDAGESMSCSALATLYLTEKGDYFDPGRGLPLLTRACDGDIALACSLWGTFFQSGKYVKRDFARAAAFYQKACAAKEAMACSNLGIMYAQGEGVSLDYARAAQLFQVSCDEKDDHGCLNLGALYFSGLGVTRDEGRAVALFDQACQGGIAKGCFGLKMACDEDIKEACAKVRTANPVRQKPGAGSIADLIQNPPE